MARLTFNPCDECNYSYTKNNQISNVCKICEFKNYIDLEEQGMLIKLPCRCDEIVWVAQKGFKPHKALYSCPSAMLNDIEQGCGIGYTKEAAEAALKEMEK